MNITLALGIAVVAYLSYVLFRSFAHQNARLAAYRRMMHDLLTNKKYQVKGRYE
jgi:hypothetical protein